MADVVDIRTPWGNFSLIRKSNFLKSKFESSYESFSYLTGVNEAYTPIPLDGDLWRYGTVDHSIIIMKNEIVCNQYVSKVI